ncbi:hypothetical protein [Streptomyces sp. S.PB5]|uniref:hypothetical protein n=1 Tax=Streptomyces sp. S.PB5 TaxID=3020844 RepID=UPI0025B2744E|nr:hypothetical protein [Streptomyces sp. S.PB5]MDN3021565.1 hypothetical protein [Streptomyces sp. S.PB5]
MTAIQWLIVVCLAALALWVVAGIIDARAARRPLPRIAQPAPPVPLLPPTRPRPDLPRARAIRRGRVRHHASQGGTR